MFPTLVSLGPFTLRTYGLVLLVSFALTLAWTRFEAKERGLDHRILFPGLAFAVFLGAILGGRLALLPGNWGLFLHAPWTLFVGWRGDQSSVGSAILAAIFAWLHVRRKRQPVLAWMDAFAPGSALGAGLLRLGCFSAGCCYGASCDLPWAVTFTDPDSLAPLGAPLHPTQLYEAAGGLAAFAVLLAFRRRFTVPGRLMGLFLCLYASFRVAVDFFRADHAPALGPLSLTQLVLGAGLLLGLALLLRPGRSGPQAADQGASQP